MHGILKAGILATLLLTGSVFVNSVSAQHRREPVQVQNESEARASLGNARARKAKKQTERKRKAKQQEERKRKAKQQAKRKRKAGQ